MRGRNRGSLHADIWSGDAAELAQCGWIAISPVGGWWKDNKRKDRAGLPIRYGLIVSLATDVATDIYSPIAVQVNIPTEIRV